MRRRRADKNAFLSRSLPLPLDRRPRMSALARAQDGCFMRARVGGRTTAFERSGLLAPRNLQSASEGRPRGCGVCDCQLDGYDDEDRRPTNGRNNVNCQVKVSILESLAILSLWP